MLEQDLLGVFVLVLANACFEPAMFERLRVPLRRAFDTWCARFDEGHIAARDAAADDVAVFHRVRQLGFDRLNPTRWRKVGPWQLQYNQLRALRPPRMSRVVVKCLQQPFDANGFHFDKPFLRRETLWQGDLLGAPVRLLYNKFPFADLHGLLVPAPAARKPQALTEPDHCLVWRVAARLGKSLPGFGFGYNAYGAYSSVNHLHFQCFVRGDGHYPVEADCWRHNGGDRPYPAAVERFDDPGEAWAALMRLHAKGRPYNLLYRPGLLYLLTRRLQGDYQHSDWTGGFAWSEMMGAVTLFDEQPFKELRAADIEAEFARLALLD